jgi:hypothetical protein
MLVLWFFLAGLHPAYFSLLLVRGIIVLPRCAR